MKQSGLIQKTQFFQIGSPQKEKHGFIIYRTANGLYRNFTSIDKEHALLAKEDGFIRTDRGVIANLKMSPSLDEKNRLLVFNIENENDGNDFVTIADNKLDVVKGYLKKLFSSKK